MRSVSTEWQPPQVFWYSVCPAATSAGGVPAQAAPARRPPDSRPSTLMQARSGNALMPVRSTEHISRGGNRRPCGVVERGPVDGLVVGYRREQLRQPGILERRDLADIGAGGTALE